jgi:formate dehydrogenase alpha subunit
MKVHTNTERVRKARKVNLELLISTHKMECHVCEKNGNCLLQDYCYEYGVKESRFSEGRRPQYPNMDPNPFIERDYEKCIMCRRCVSVCEKVTGARAINILGRGLDTKIAAAFDGNLEDSPCVFCGQCIMVCPVGALTSKVSAAAGGRPSDVDKKVLTTCGYCGTGCKFELNVKDNKVVGVTSVMDKNLSPVNNGALCVKGRFGWDFINSPDRLTTPLIKENGEFRTASWDEALKRTADSFGKLKERYGSDSLAVFSSARATNEENYLAQKFTRAVLGTNNIDHCARL